VPPDNATRGDDEVEYRILGPLEVYGNDGARVAFRPRESRLIAVLLVLAWTPVSRDTLTRALWGDRLPRHPRDALRLWFSRTRTALGPDGIRCLKTLPGAYIADPPPQDLDLGRFWQLRTAADRLVQERELRPASTALQRALACWREPALADLPDVPEVEAQWARVLEQRRLAELARADLLLELGDHDRILPELHAQAVDDPLGERAWAQFILALHQSGRRDAALGAYSRIRAALVRAYGTEPGAELKDLLRLVRDRIPPAPRLPVPPHARFPAR
jgi:DNA-binding SARP family transcriptional activator